MTPQITIIFNFQIRSNLKLRFISTQSWEGKSRCYRMFSWFSRNFPSLSFPWLWKVTSHYLSYNLNLGFCTFPIYSCLFTQKRINSSKRATVQFNLPWLTWLTMAAYPCNFNVAKRKWREFLWTAASPFTDGNLCPVLLLLTSVVKSLGKWVLDKPKVTGKIFLLVHWQL